MTTLITKAAGVTVQLKMTDQFYWVGIMNAIKGQTVEIILSEIIYN